MTIAAQQAERRGAAATIRRGLGLSPELRRGLPATLVLALLATAGRVIVPVAVQQIIDGGGEDRFMLLDDLCAVMEGSSMCAMGSMTPKPVRSALKHFPEDFGRAGAEGR